MKGDRIHVLDLSLGLVTVSGTTGQISGAGAATQIIDLVQHLSPRFGRNLPACAVYDVTKMELSLRPTSQSTDEDRGFALSGQISWCTPTRARVKAMRWAASEFFRQRTADYGRQAKLQFYPLIMQLSSYAQSDPNVPTILSRRDDDGRIYTLTGAKDGTQFYGIFDDYNAQKPKYPVPAQRPGAQAQDVDYYDDRASEVIESTFQWDVGYGIRQEGRMSSSSSGPNSGATLVNSSTASGTSSGTPPVWNAYELHMRSPGSFWTASMEAGPLRSYPILCGQIISQVDIQSWPKPQNLEVGGTEEAYLNLHLEVVGWSELK